MLARRGFTKKKLHMTLIQIGVEESKKELHAYIGI